jgi:hypothetical protein
MSDWTGKIDPIYQNLGLVIQLRIKKNILNLFYILNCISTFMLMSCLIEFRIKVENQNHN